MDFQPGEPLTLYTISMLDSRRGWGIGQNLSLVMDHLLFTVDGGQIWMERSPQRMMEQTRPVLSLAVPTFADERHAWVVYASREPSYSLNQLAVWSTSDSGETWEESQPLSFGDLSLEMLIPSDLGFSDLQHGWLMVHLGGGENEDSIAIFTSSDGGASWRRVADIRHGGLGIRCRKSGLFFVDPQHGWLTGDCSGKTPGVYFYTTSDGGQSWRLVSLSDPQDTPGLLKYPENACMAEQLSFSGSQNGRLVVRCTLPGSGMARTWLYFTRDGGKTWAPQAAPSLFGNYQFLDPLAGWWLGAPQTNGVEGAGLYRTGDGGKTWTQIISPAWLGAPDFIDAENGYVVARAGDAVALLVTKDGGRTWETIQPLAQP